MIKRLVSIGAFLFLLVLPGCATTQYDFGKTCIYHPAAQPSFSCQANEPGKEWVQENKSSLENPMASNMPGISFEKAYWLRSLATVVGEVFTKANNMTSNQGIGSTV